MDRKQYELIKNIVEDDFENKNIGDLKSLRRFLCEKIKRLEDYEYYGEGNFILLQTYNDFYDENFTNEEKAHHQLKLLGAIYADINFTKVRKLRIYQTIGIDEAKILNHSGCGKATLSIYEEKLNKHGLSIYDYMPPQKYKELALNTPDDGPKIAKIM